MSGCQFAASVLEKAQPTFSQRQPLLDLRVSGDVIRVVVDQELAINGGEEDPEDQPKEEDAREERFALAPDFG